MQKNWRDRAACGDLSLEESERLFFPSREGIADGYEARRICFGCPVRQACLEDAFAYESRRPPNKNHMAGIRGGLFVNERVRLLKERISA